MIRVPFTPRPRLPKAPGPLTMADALRFAEAMFERTRNAVFQRLTGQEWGPAEQAVNDYTRDLLRPLR